jgi:2-keto-4-pentenoate hydratase/2-oxohepta-3-ene-1,7-dioic acid hydratase in catechol pathway
MKLASYRTRKGDNYGIVSGDGLISLKDRLPDKPQTLRDLLAKDALDEARGLAGETPDTEIADVEFLPVIPHPRKFFAIGINYRDHAAETGRSVEPRPSIFSRFDDTLIGHGQPMVRPRISHHFDFEGELAVIIGQAGRYIKEADAMGHVAGYSCFVDGSVRDYQKHSVTAGKNFPATGPFGPWMVTADEIPDPSRLVLTTRLNGEVMQRSGLDMLINTVPVLISYLSEITGLEPGDVIATGTPAGVGHRRTPPLWMKPGDTLEVEISGVGTLVNPIMDEA